jgi:murein DD-endopeptidase MepM/ murein hydrolase activator NlpD
MYDYKFRQRDLTFDKPRRPLRRVFIRVVGLGLAAAAIFTALQFDLPWHAAPSVKGSESDIIPLSLPPRRATPEDGRPIRSDSEGRSKTPDERALAKAMTSLLRGAPTASVRTSAEQDVSGQNAIAGEDEEARNSRVTATEATARQEADQGTWIEHVVEPGDTLARIFSKNDLDPHLLQEIVASGEPGRRIENIRPGDTLRIHLNEESQLARVQLELDALRSVEFSATDEGFKGALKEKTTKAKATAAAGVIDQSLFSSAQKSGLPDAVTMKLATIFGWDIDFALEIRSGDRFAVIYEELWADGEVVAPGEILAAEFVNQGRSFRAIRYQDSTGKVDYYAPDGKPLRKTFFRTPVKFSRISSRFTNKRWHPILKRERAHRGVDYAAPTGTPVIATGDATVKDVGWKKGYGKVVTLSHGRTYQTVYGHLSRFAKGLSKGDRVAQGQVIGYVGQTGLATGPHLHYEFLVNGVHRNPLTVKAPFADPLVAKERKRFDSVAQSLLARLTEASGDVLVADAR